MSSRFLPPAALQSELARRAKILDEARDAHEKAVEALIRAQARLDHARNGAAAKQSARDVAAERQGDVGEQLQVAKYFAEYFAGVWERKESEAAEAAQALHRSEVELKQAGSAVEAVRRQTAAVVEAKEDADGLLAAASAAYEKAKRRVDEAADRAREEAERDARKAREEADAVAAALAASMAAAAAKAAGAHHQQQQQQAQPPVEAVAAAAAAAANGVAGWHKEGAAAVVAAAGKRSRSRSRSRSGRREQRRGSRSRSRERRRSGRGRSRSRDGDQRRSGRSDRGKSRSRSRSRGGRRSGDAGSSRPSDPQQDSSRRRGEASRDKEVPQQNAEQPEPRLSGIRVSRGLVSRFEAALLACLEAKRPPFNVSLINDRMKRADPRWSCQAELGCSFSLLCQAMQREGLVQLLRKGDAAWEVVGSRLEARVRGPPPPARPIPPPRRPPASDGSDRWVMH